MSSNQRTKYYVRKRIFLNRNLDMRAFAIAIVEDTRHFPNETDSEWKWGEIQLNLGDCYRHVSFDFTMDTKAHRADSLYKIRKIAEIVNAEHHALGEVHMLGRIERRRFERICRFVAAAHD